MTSNEGLRLSMGFWNVFGEEFKTQEIKTSEFHIPREDEKSIKKDISKNESYRTSSDGFSITQDGSYRNSKKMGPGAYNIVKNSKDVSSVKDSKINPKNFF